MSVLLIVMTFAFFIALDYLVGRVRARREVKAPAKALVPEPPVAPAFGTAPVWVGGYLLPEEYHYHPGHTWARPAGRDTVLVGLDDFARKLIGPARRFLLPATGSRLEQGAPAFGVQVDGRAAGFLAPVDGQVLEVNKALLDRPELASDDPYRRGWVMKLRNADLARSLRNLLSGSTARRWTEDARERLEHQLMALSGSVLQDGGEPVADFARHLPAEDWHRLIREFLLTGEDSDA